MHPRRTRPAVPSISGGKTAGDGDLNPRAARITHAPRQKAEEPACGQYTSLLSDCEQRHPDFLDLNNKDQASCLCPDRNYRFDNHVSSCLASITGKKTSTTDEGTWPVDEETWPVDEGNVKFVTRWSDFCQSYGPPPTPTQPRPESPSTPTLIACSTMQSLLTSCADRTPSFLDMNTATQAACLCYTSTEWMPGMWNDAVTSCAAEAAVASSTSIAGVASGFKGLCDSVGPPTPTHVSSPDHAGVISGSVIGGVAGLTLIITGILAAVKNFKAR